MSQKMQARFRLVYVSVNKFVFQLVV